MEALREPLGQNGGWFTGAKSRRSSSLGKQVGKGFFRNANYLQWQRRQKRVRAIVSGPGVDSHVDATPNASALDHLIDADHAVWSDPLRCVRRSDGREEEGVSEKLDQWVRDSVVEIVSNIQEAPFLVHIYSDDREGSSSTTTPRLVREKATADSWPLIRGRWEGGSPTPNCIILVEELNSEEVAGSLDEAELSCSDINNQLHSTTKVWGVLIQGKGVNRSACYILKTCRVQSCTHFCLVKVECFVENANTQLRKMWLQR
ncbi:hypothetical protein RJ640_006832 [Escallonia rubra]|uniref:DUF7804 domain-containing protein n=1 Tax=Escallonia rubra TaxID=112253 RepID=A0AA88QBJ3_9ASTE|nr:hypothetical protein RJ640_006832 [Escallonia rubra]